MKRKIIAAAVTVLLGAQILMMAGCSSKVEAQNLMENIQSEKVELKQEEFNMEQSNAKATDFAVRLLQNGLEGGENTLISPVSVLYALAMTTNGAKENTLEQMETVLGMKAIELNNYLYSYKNDLPENSESKLSIANSVWFTSDERFTVNEDFLQTNANYYGADIYRAPFDGSTVKDINNWVKNKTDKMIPKIIDEISKDVVMYLVNALAFEAEWPETYLKTQVRDGVFTLEDSTTRKAKFMHSTENYYLEDEYSTGFLKYYKGNKYAFVALLPEEGMSVSDYVSSLNGEDLKAMLEYPEQVSVYAAIPKFETEYSTEMKDVLSQMGMPEAFDGNMANFTGLGTSTAGNIFINKVLHKTFMSVGEKGTKAGAATVVEMVDKSAIEIQDVKEVYLNRPFVYMVVDCENHIPLFIGTMMDLEPDKEKGTIVSKKEIPYGVQYIRTDGYVEDCDYPQPYLIGSREELNAYYEKNKDIYDLERHEKVYADTTIGFLDACDKYTEDFFEEKYLVFVVLEEGSGSIRHEAKNVKLSEINADKIIEIFIETMIPEACTDDMAEWHIMFEIDKENDVYSADNVQIYLDDEVEIKDKY